MISTVYFRNYVTLFVDLDSYVLRLNENEIMMVS